MKRSSKKEKQKVSHFEKLDFHQDNFHQEDLPAEAKIFHKEHENLEILEVEEIVSSRDGDRFFFSLDSLKLCEDYKSHDEGLDSFNLEEEIQERQMEDFTESGNGYRKHSKVWSFTKKPLKSVQAGMKSLSTALANSELVSPVPKPPEYIVTVTVDNRISKKFYLKERPELYLEDFLQLIGSEEAKKKLHSEIIKGINDSTGTYYSEFTIEGITFEVKIVNKSKS